MKKWVAIILIALIHGVILEYVFLHLVQSKSLSSFGVTMICLPNGRPGTVSIHVRDALGFPASRLKVVVEDVSSTWNAETNADGKAIFQINENIILSIWVNGKCIAKSNFIKSIESKNGVDFYYVN